MGTPAIEYPTSASLDVMPDRYTVDKFLYHNRVYYNQHHLYFPGIYNYASSEYWSEYILRKDRFFNQYYGLINFGFGLDAPTHPIRAIAIEQLGQCGHNIEFINYESNFNFPYLVSKKEHYVY